MPTSTRTQNARRRWHIGLRHAKLVVLSIFLPTKVLTEMAERR